MQTFQKLPASGDEREALRVKGQFWTPPWLAKVISARTAVLRAPFVAHLILEGKVRAAGAGPSDILKVTAYIVDVERWPRFNAIYSETMGNARPARTVVPVPQLHYGYLVEIDAIAASNG